MNTLFLLLSSFVTLVWSQYPFHHYACIHERTAENKIYEALRLQEDFSLQQYSKEECFKQCGNRTLLLYKSHDTPLDNCFCIGQQKNISLWIYPSDIISREEDECPGRSLYCRVNDDFNWCALLDQKLNQSNYENNVEDQNIDINYKNFNPKCVHRKSIHTISLIFQGNTSNVAWCKAKCSNFRFYVMKVCSI